MLFQLKKLPEIINLTRFLKSFWILYIDQIIVYYAFYSKLTFYIIKDRCQMHTLKVFRSPVWLLLHRLSSPHYRYIRKMRCGDRLPLTQLPMQSVPSTTKVVSSNPVHGEVYSIQHYVIKFVSGLRQVGGFLRVLRFHPPIKLTSPI